MSRLKTTVAGYEIVRELVATDWFALYKATRVSDNTPVLLKTLRSSIAGEARLLEREFEILTELSIEGIPRAHELIRQEHANWLVLDDRAGVALNEVRSACLSDLQLTLRITSQIASLLSELHRLGIAHRNLNSHSVLVNSDTREIQLINFEFAARTTGDSGPPVQQLSREALPYIAPEQTGRMNRTTDYRADLYSLGVVLYELLTGASPFKSDDPLETIHGHIAKPPKPPSEVDARIPRPVSRIALKLLSKNAEDRYQSALGLKEDLETCARFWREKKRIDEFDLGQCDVPDRFVVSQRLYGRQNEVVRLLDLFDVACEGASAMMLVSGYAGIGKSALIKELYGPTVRERGYFISGKCDQIARSMPFGVLIQAFRGLIQQLLTESEARLADWKSSITDVLEANGGVIAEVIPEIELVIGKQAAAPQLAPTEAQNRFHLAFQNFVGAIARPDHPLVIFLDDLQWVDSATLGLFQPLLAGREVKHLFVIGAYRNNEVEETHPLSRAMRTLESEGVRLHQMTLGPLGLADLNQFVSDTLHCAATNAEPLTLLVHEKTGGNPFFVIQFLRTLWQDRLIQFDYDKGHWTFEMDAIAAAGMTDNVIDLMTANIKRLSPKTQAALTLGACIGNQFDTQTLAVVSQQSSDQAAADLIEAVDEGLILPVGGLRASGSQTYGFLHDRVQQAAYALIPANDKQLVHLTVGRLLLEKADLEGNEDRLFDIAHHLNVGSELIADTHECLSLARLNLSAGRKAKSSTAYESALEYFEAGLRILTEEHWKTEYELAFDVNLEAAECQYLCGKFSSAEYSFEKLLNRARSNLDKAKVYRLRSVQYENLSRYSDALSIARECLSLFGVSFPDSETEKRAALESEIANISDRVGERSIESLIDLPRMSDSETRMVMNILTDIWSAAYILGDPTLARLISAMLVRLSLTHGNAEESAYGYVTHAITVGPVRGDYKTAYEFGRLALRVNEQFNDSRRRAKIHQQFHAHVNLWRQPMQSCVLYAREACRSGLESGDFLYAAYGASTESWPAFLSTQDLAAFVRDYAPNLALIEKLKITGFADALRLMLSWAKALAGKTATPLSLSDETFDERAYAEAYRENAFFTTFHAVARLNLCYQFDEFGKALEATRQARDVVYQLSGTIWPVIFEFWNSLTLAANFQDTSQEEKVSYLEEMDQARRTLAPLGDSCPENFLCYSELISAEIARISNRQLDAIDHYENAINYARGTGVLQHRALAAELYGKFWLARGTRRIASVFLAEARDCYSDWGAKAKFDAIQKRYSDLFDSKTARSNVTATASEADSFDVATALKAARALAREIDLEKLLARLLAIAIENAGAERGSLILERNGQPFVQAEGTIDAIEVRIDASQPLDRAKNLSKGIVNYVRRTLETVVLADATIDDRHAADPYVVRRKPRSIMCMPVLKQGQLVGVLYLENNLLDQAFTTERIELMELLSAEAAISIENARLYAEMKDEAEHRRSAEETLRSIVEGTAAVTGGDFFSALVRHLAAAIGVKYAFVTECTDHTKSRVRTLAFWSADSLAANIEYELTGTPCAKVIQGAMCHHPINLQRLFPEDTDLVTLSAESFVGLPMVDASGEVLGHLAVLDDEPLPDASRALSLLAIFAARATAELQRLNAEQELRRALGQVEQLKNRLHAENVYLQEEIRREHNFEEIVGNSPALLEVLNNVERVAPTDSTVLINGETGTGKELIARAIHDRSQRKKHPLVKVNCGAISAGLVESELFGHVKGAFTGAIDRRVGRFELADGGTLFLDEVSELPLDTQVKLLRVLQESEFEPVGSSRTVRVDVRIIAASNRNLEEAVQQGRFRSDLFYRLNVFPLRVPALRERASDIPQLTMFFLSHFARKLGKKIDSVTQETMKLLLDYSWPGNVRELQNVIERGVVLSEGASLRLDRDLVPTTGKVRMAAASTSQSFDSPVKDLALQHVERDHIIAVLDQAGWVIEGSKGAAQILKLHPNTLRSRMKKLGIKRSRPHDIS